MLDLARGLYLLALRARPSQLVAGETGRIRGGTPRTGPLHLLGHFRGNDYPKLAGTGAQTIVSEVDHLGQRQDVRLGGYGGCLHSFPDLPFRPGSDVAELVQAVRRGEVQCETEGDHGDEAEDP